MEIDAIAEAFLKKAKEHNERMSCSKNREELHKEYEEAMIRYRHELEPYVYQHLTQTYGTYLDTFWKSHQFPIKSKNAWVIVERRCHVNWWFILRNIAWAGPDMALYIFCSDENITFLKKMLGDKEKSVYLIPWFKGYAANRCQAVEEYNRALTNSELYKRIQAEYIIVVQLDTYIRHKIPPIIFIGDYYGAPWNWDSESPGGGGLSIRKCSSMIKLCTEHPRPDEIPEDKWISDTILHNEYKYPPLEFRSFIFSESFPVCYFIGVHQFWTYLDTYSVYSYDEYCKILKEYLTIYIDD